MRALITAIALLSLVGCGNASAGEEASGPTTLEAAATECTEPPEGSDTPAEADLGEYVRVGDAGKSLTVATPSEGELASMLSVMVMACLLGESGASDATIAQVEQTSALMGRQEAEWGGISVSWSYHPDSGMSAVFTEV